MPLSQIIESGNCVFFINLHVSICSWNLRLSQIPTVNNNIHEKNTFPIFNYYINYFLGRND